MSVSENSVEAIATISIQIIYKSHLCRQQYCGTLLKLSVLQFIHKSFNINRVKKKINGSYSAKDMSTNNRIHRHWVKPGKIDIKQANNEHTPC